MAYIEVNCDVIDWIVVKSAVALWQGRRTAFAKRGGLRS
jgi:hypothetical protein